MGALNRAIQEEPFSSSESAGCQKARGWLFQVSKFSICSVSNTPSPSPCCSPLADGGCRVVWRTLVLPLSLCSDEGNGTRDFTPDNQKAEVTRLFLLLCLTCWLVSINSIRFYTSIAKTWLVFLQLSFRKDTKPLNKQLISFHSALTSPDFSYKGSVFHVFRASRVSCVSCVSWVLSLSPCCCARKLFSFFFFSSITIPLKISNSRLKESGSQLLLSGLNLAIVPLAPNLCWCNEDENLAFCAVVNRGKIESI